MKVEIPGFTTLYGSPVTILRLMQEVRRFDDCKDLDEYIRIMQENGRRLLGVALNVEGDTLEERAESLLREMAAHELVILLDD